MRQEAVRRGTHQDETKPGPVLKEPLPPRAVVDPAPRFPAIGISPAHKSHPGKLSGREGQVFMSLLAHAYALRRV